MNPPPDESPNILREALQALMKDNRLRLGAREHYNPAAYQDAARFIAAIRRSLIRVGRVGGTDEDDRLAWTVFSQSKEFKHFSPDVRLPLEPDRLYEAVRESAAAYLASTSASDFSISDVLAHEPPTTPSPFRILTRHALRALAWAAVILAFALMAFVGTVLLRPVPNLPNYLPGDPRSEEFGQWIEESVDDGDRLFFAGEYAKSERVYLRVINRLTEALHLEQSLSQPDGSRSDRLQKAKEIVTAKASLARLAGVVSSRR